MPLGLLRDCGLQNQFSFLPQPERSAALVCEFIRYITTSRISCMALGVTSLEAFAVPMFG